MDKYVNADELAKYLGVSRMTIYNMMKDGQLPKGNKLRGLRRWNLDDVREFLKGVKNGGN